jgi:acyl-CoA synthetase (AMP-forming)/AMP-acid ligase II
MKFPNVVRALETAASSAGSRLAFRILSDGDRVVEGITFAELHDRSFALAKVLRLYASRGDRALLFAETSVATIVALYACILAGIIAVPVASPHLNRIQTRTNTLLNIVRSCRPKLVLARSLLYDARAKFLEAGWELLAPKWLQTDAPPEQIETSSAALRLPDPSDITFLQYTSGTTSRPRGVIITQSALVANQQMIYNVTRAAHQDEWAVSWLPFFHDMGISFLFHTVFLQSTCTLLSPGQFVQSPVRWLRAISHYKVAFSAAPNFALELVASKVKEQQLQGIDLRSLKVLIVGAEPVRLGTLERFVAKLTQSGFNPAALHPCFGLAETTLMATHGRRGGVTIKSFQVAALAQRRAVEVDAGEVESEARFARKSVQLVSNGASGEGHSMLIVDPQTHRPVTAQQIGEIWLEGPSIGAGYWQEPEESRATFAAEPVPPNGKRYLRTGDLGFENDGQLFVAGRLKDLIIVNGRNIYPEDVEVVAENVDRRIVRGGVVAFEQSLGDVVGIAILAEFSSGSDSPVDTEELALRIRRLVMTEVEADVTYVGLLPPRRLPRTTSGKIARAECRRQLERKELPVLSGWRLCANT